jgi:glycosyltransferase involved in cell wall biosynthesis
MKIAVLSSATGGGAGIAASRVADALRDHGRHEVHLADISALGALVDDVSPQVNVSNGRLSNTHFTADRSHAPREWLVRFLKDFDVVNVHWSSYLLSAADLQSLAAAGARLLLTMHDFNAVTGGCHYPAGCTGLFRGCESCPQIDPTQFSSAEVIRVKAQRMAMLRHPNVHLCAPSRYVLDAAARASGLHPDRMHLIRNPYTPLRLQRPSSNQRPFTVLMVADSLAERRKGAVLACDALQEFVAAQGDLGGRKLRVHVAGTAPESLIRALRSTAADVRVHGRITEHARLASLYAQSDVQLLTSYEDNWPNVLCEGGAYGCLAVVGPGHGCEEFVRQFDAGALAQDYSAKAFASALAMVAALDPPSLMARQRLLAEKVLEEHEPATISRQYTQAFEGMLRGDAMSCSPLPAGTSVAESSISSNLLGVDSRLLLSGAGGTEARQLEICRVEAPHSGGSVILHAVYGEPASTSASVHSMTNERAVIPLQTTAGRLRHVFAREQSDYGLTVLRCALSAPASTPCAGSPAPV